MQKFFLKKLSGSLKISEPIARFSNFNKKAGSLFQWASSIPCFQLKIWKMIYLV